MLPERVTQIYGVYTTYGRSENRSYGQLLCESTRDMSSIEASHDVELLDRYTYSALNIDGRHVQVYYHHKHTMLFSEKFVVHMPGSHGSGAKRPRE
eukprot:7068580-Karenia_brevis.AAC.1